jgi:hypothetical protein
LLVRFALPVISSVIPRFPCTEANSEINLDTPEKNHLSFKEEEEDDSNAASAPKVNQKPQKQ